jgi:hypothetical protein
MYSNRIFLFDRNTDKKVGEWDGRKGIFNERSHAI